ncbi:unnamed protein product [Vicia faba]|uniref:STAS domain-containing protein n=1 Tax=Vicia faba TaxID=3906 RepID=A0AAV0ZB84_VICFA|nr:unnamed protein product [Vicia faba]
MIKSFSYHIILRWVQEEEECVKENNGNALKFIILDMTSITTIDTSGLENLGELRNILEKRSLQFVLVNSIGNMMEKLHMLKILDTFGFKVVYLTFTCMKTSEHTMLRQQTMCQRCRARLPQRVTGRMRIAWWYRGHEKVWSHVFEFFYLFFGSEILRLLLVLQVSCYGFYGDKRLIVDSVLCRTEWDLLLNIPISISANPESPYVFIWGCDPLEFSVKSAFCRLISLVQHDFIPNSTTTKSLNYVSKVNI